MGPDTTLKPDSDTFDAIWDDLAKLGYCDARGGAEYERVKHWWFLFGYRNALHAFIIDSANTMACADALAKQTSHKGQT